MSHLWVLDHGHTEATDMNPPHPSHLTPASTVTVAAVVSSAFSPMRSNPLKQLSCLSYRTAYSPPLWLLCQWQVDWWRLHHHHAATEKIESNHTRPTSISFLNTNIKVTRLQETSAITSAITFNSQLCFTARRGHADVAEMPLILKLSVERRRRSGRG